MSGATVKLAPPLANPPTVTTMFPVVAPAGTGATMLVSLQLVGVARVPLKVTVLAPCADPKFEPLIVMGVPVSPEEGFKPLIEGVTVKRTPLLAPAPDTATTTLPVLAPLGTGTTMLVWVQLVGVPKIPLKATVLPCCGVPKVVPVIVTEVPTGPAVGLKLVIVGVTVNKTPLLTTPPNVTTTLPVVAPAGTGTTIAPPPQLVGVARVPLNVTVLLPCDVPQFPPLIVTDVPTAPDVGLSEAMLGSRTVKLAPLLASPLTVTTTLPVVAPLGTGTAMLVSLQLVGVAAALLKVTELVP